MPVDAKQLRFGPFQLDAQLGQLQKNGFGLKLQGQPVQILEILLKKTRRTGHARRASPAPLVHGYFR